jgi:non-specific serine/threonine protein kinase
VQESLRLKRPLDDLLGFAWCLEALAWIAASDHNAHRAATLLGAAAEIWQAIGSAPVSVSYLFDYHEECQRQTRSMLGEKAFQAAFHQGRELSVQDAIAYALDEKTLQPQPPADTETETTLTRHEQQVAELIAEGLSNKEIALRLAIAQRTAEGHVERILAKLGFTSRPQIATWITQGAATDPDQRPPVT